MGAASINPSRLGRIGVKALFFYMLTSALAVAVGLLFANLFSPGKGMVLVGIVDAAGKTITAPSFMNTLINIIPTNPFNAITSGNMLPTILVSIIFGIGVFALIAVVFGKQGTRALGPLAMVTLTVYCAFIFQAVVVYGGILAAYKINFIEFLSRAKAAIVTAFVTRSSGGTLPVSMEVAEKNPGVSRSVYSFTLSLGATINMDGAAIYQRVCALFVSIAIGAPLSFEQQLTVIATAVLVSIGSAGLPGAIMLLMVLDSVGLSVEPGSAVAAAYAMILGIDALLGMGRTALNVTGDLTVTAIVAKTEDELDQVQWDNASPAEAA